MAIRKPTKRVLRRKYWNEEMNLRELGAEYGVSYETVRTWLDFYRIDRRDSSEGHTVRGAKMTEEKKPTKRWLYDNYIRKKRGKTKISRELSVSYGTMDEWLEGYGIPIRDRAQIATSSHESLRPTKKKLHRMYITEEMGAPEIAEELGCSPGIVYRWLEDEEIPTRSKSEAFALLERGMPRPTKREVRRLYVKHGRNGNKAAKAIGTYPGKVYGWMREYGIPVRNGK